MAYLAVSIRHPKYLCTGERNRPPAGLLFLKAKLAQLGFPRSVEMLDFSNFDSATEGDIVGHLASRNF